MLYRSLARFLLLLNLPIFLTGQASHRSSFDWDSPKFHHLDYFNSHVSEAKNLSADLKPALVRAIEARLRPQMADLEIANEKELRKIAEQSRFELVDLNADGVSEVVVQPIGLKAGCGATGNCPFWVFALDGGKYRLILGTSGQIYRVESHGSNGYSDISVADHDSATEKTIYQFRFLRGQYKKIACYQAWWSNHRRKIAGAAHRQFLSRTFEIKQGQPPFSSPHLAHTSPQLVDPAPSSLALKGKQEFLSDKRGLPLCP